jgi:Predicted dehydrogenase
MALKLLHSRGKRNGIESEFISVEEARRIAPILDTTGIKAVLHEPIKGYCDPASVTQAYAKAARDHGRQDPSLHPRHRHEGRCRTAVGGGDAGRAISAPIISSMRRGSGRGRWRRWRASICR